MSDPRIKDTVAHQSLYWLLAALVMVVLPHATRIPVWVTGFFVALLGWRYIIAARGWRIPPRWLRAVLTVTGIAVVYSSYGTLVGRDAGVALLLAMLAIKLLEMVTHRDVYVTVLIAYFLVITHFLYSQTILMAVYMCAVVVVITAALIDLNRFGHGGSVLARQNLRFALSILLQAVPFMLVLFLLFPRIGGPLWGLPEDAFGSTSGLSDEMSPGDITQLILSDNVAFRVSFDGPIPSAGERYWRGPVLWHTDGRRWRAAPADKPLMSEPPTVDVAGTPLTYTITLEPHKRRWLYALDLPDAAPAQAVRTADFQLHAREDVKQRARYQVTSHTTYTMRNLSEAERERALQLPAVVNRRTRELAQRWRVQHEPAGVVAQALRHFGTENFTYTLTPPALASADPIDQFLFSTRQGFCEHYSSAFVFLMRAAGIPARVVTGYQGGELNPVGEYLVVRQRDAHAWAEVWLDGFGWLRIDPTSAVAPERIVRSIQVTPGREGAAVQFELPGGEGLRAIVERLRQGWDSVNNGWNQWVLNYTQIEQEQFLKGLGLGIESWKGMVTALAVALVVLIAVIAAMVLWRDFQPQDAVAALWRRFCRKLARKGVARHPAEGPLDYARRVGVSRPELRDAVQHIADLYVTLRYAPPHPQRDSELQRLRRAIGQFSP